MGEKQYASAARPLAPTDFWDALAPHHASIENHYLDVPTIRRIAKELDEPILIVGAGQGLIVAELRQLGLCCEGVDWSTEMIRYARLRRGMSLIQADARAIPVADQSYGTVIYATGVIDFTSDEEAVRAMLQEGKRIVTGSGKIFVAFYKVSAAQEDFMARVGLLQNHAIPLKESLRLYLLNPAQTVAWVAKRTGLSYWRTVALVVRMATRSTMREKRLTFRMQKIFQRMDDPASLINAAAEKQPYRNENEIRNLFIRLAIPVKEIRPFPSCHLVRVQ